MAHQTIDRKGRIRIYSRKFYWECACGSFCGWINHNIPVELKRHNRCPSCNRRTDQHSMKIELKEN